MPRAAEAREWWADVEDVRERIERRRERERSARGSARSAAPPPRSEGCVKYGPDGASWSSATLQRLHCRATPAGGRAGAFCTS